MSFDSIFYDIIKKNKNMVVVFFASITFFFIIHLGPFINRVYSQDSVGIFYQFPPTYHIKMSGRYIRALIDYIYIVFGYNYVIPYFNLIIAIIFYSLSVVLLCKIFGIINNIFLSVLFSFFFISHFFLAAILTYFQDIPTYSFACLVSTFAIYYLNKKFDKLNIMNCVVIVLLNLISFGILQNYFMYISTLMLFILLKYLFDDNYNIQFLIIRAIQLLLVLIATLIIYFVILFFVNNIYEISHESRLYNIKFDFSVYKFVSCIVTYYLLFLIDYSGFNLTPLSKVLYFVGFLSVLYYIVNNLLYIYKMNKKDKKLKLIFAFLLVFLIPISSSSLRFIFVMSTSTIVTYTSYDVLLFVSLVYIYNKYKKNVKKIFLMMLFLMIFVFHRIYFTELRYELQYQKLEQMKILSNNIANMIKSVDGYDKKMPVYINIDKESLWNNISNNFVDYNLPNSFISDEDYIAWWSLPSIFNIYGGMLNSIYINEYNNFDILELPDYKEMPKYPNKNCVKVINGVVVVKIG